MNGSTMNIIHEVLDEYTPQLIAIAIKPDETNSLLQEMRNKLTNTISAQYMNTISRFMCHKDIELDEILSSSPPKSHIISTTSPITPEKIHKRLKVDK